MTRLCELIEAQLSAIHQRGGVPKAIGANRKTRRALGLEVNQGSLFGGQIMAYGGFPVYVSGCLHDDQIVVLQLGARE